MKTEENQLKIKPATDCFAYDNRTGECSCLSVKRCPGKTCPFYKHIEQAIEEATNSLNCGYDQSIWSAIEMMENNRAAN